MWRARSGRFSRNQSSRFVKPGSRSSTSSVEDLAREQRDEPDHRADAQRHRAAVDVQLVVVEAVLLVPQAGAAERVHGVGDGDEVLEELATPCPRRPDRPRASSSAIDSIVRAVERHPRGAVGLLEVAAGRAAAASGRRRRCCRARGSRRRRGCCPSASLRFTHQVKLISSFWNTRARNSAVALAARGRSSCRRATPPRRAPAGSRRRTRTRRRAAGRSGACTTRAGTAASCSLANCGIDPRERDHVEREVPRRVPRVLPLVGHRDDVAVVEVRPVGVAAVRRAAGRRRLRGIALEPVAARRSGRTACTTAARRSAWRATRALVRRELLAACDAGVERVGLARCAPRRRASNAGAERRRPSTSRRGGRAAARSDTAARPRGTLDAIRARRPWCRSPSGFTASALPVDDARRGTRPSRSGAAFGAPKSRCALVSFSVKSSAGVAAGPRSATSR